MSHVTAIVSMLHEPAGRDSATRLFRTEPVLCWTLERLARCRRMADVSVLCWEDQLPGVEPIAEAKEAYVLAKGPRVRIQSVEAIAATRKWADGWRGGLLQTCDFDLGFYAPWVREVVENLESEAVLLIDAAGGLVDPQLVDGLIEHAERHVSAEMVFSQAAPGLCGVLLRLPLLERLVASHVHPGKLLHYLPDQPAIDPIAREHCFPVAAPIARSTYRFKLDSERQVNRVGQAMMSLNGQLVHSSAEELVGRMAGAESFDALPREVVVEVGTGRRTRPVFWPGQSLGIKRPDLPVETAKRLFEELAAMDDVRVTLAGVGDPLECPQVFRIVAAARAAGIDTMHIETDLLADELTLAQLATCGVDVVSFHLPATTPETYRAVMRADAFMAVLENVRSLLSIRQEHKTGLPLLVPLFVKCRQNLGEMELWYDQWLRALGCATIVGPSDYAGQIADVAVADMAPPKRRPCARLGSRLTVLSDGRIVSCEQDVLGRQVLAQAGVDDLREVWRARMGVLRAGHTRGEWAAQPLCAHCREWHRP